MRDIRNENLCVAGEDIKKNNAVAFKDGKVYNLSSEEYGAIIDEEQLVDELCNYCDLNYMDNVLEIVRDVVRHKVESAIRILRMKKYNRKVEEQKLQK